MLHAALALAVLLSPSAPPQAEMLVSTQELARLLNDPAVVVLHVVDRELAFVGGHIPGARLTTED